MLTARLHQLADRYERDFGVDVRPLEGGGAAGGLAGGLAALGARLLGGFDLVADHVDLDDRVAEADLVVTGEGHLDAQSLDGKVVGGVCEVAVAAGTPVVVIVGSADAEARAVLEATATTSAPVTVVDLVATFGTDRAFGEPLRCIEQAARSALSAA
jgi:glycerate kinase